MYKAPIIHHRKRIPDDFSSPVTPRIYISSIHFVINLLIVVPDASRDERDRSMPQMPRCEADQPDRWRSHDLDTLSVL